MNDEDELDSSAGSFSSRSSPRSFDMPGGALSSLSSLSSSSSGVIVRCSLLLVRLSSRLALLASCLSCGLSSGVSAVSDCYPFRSFRPIVVSFGSPLVRQVGRGDSVLRFCLGSPRSLLPVACRGGAVDVAGAVFLSWVLLVAAVSMASAVCVISVIPRSRCLPWVILSGWRVSLVLLLASLVVGCRHGLIVVGCCRRGSVSSSIVMARRRPALLALGCRRRSCLPRGFSSAVDRFVDRLAARPLASSCLSGDGTACGAGSVLSSRCRPCCLGCRPIDLARLPWVRLVLSVCFPAVSVSCGSVAVGMSGRGCFASVPVARAACLGG